MACFGFQSGLPRSRSSRILQATGIVVYGAASSSLSWSINDIPRGKSLTKDKCYGMGLNGEYLPAPIIAESPSLDIGLTLPKVKSARGCEQEFATPKPGCLEM